MTIVLWIVITIVALVAGFSLGETAGYDQAMWIVRDVLEHPEAKNTDPEKLHKFQFVHYKDPTTIYQGEMKKDKCITSWENSQGQPVFVDYSKENATQYIKEGTWILQDTKREL